MVKEQKQELLLPREKAFFVIGFLIIIKTPIDVFTYGHENFR